MSWLKQTQYNTDQRYENYYLLNTSHAGLCVQPRVGRDYKESLSFCNFVIKPQKQPTIISFVPHLFYPDPPYLLLSSFRFHSEALFCGLRDVAPPPRLMV